MKVDKVYMCIGESFNSNPFGNCGLELSLYEWLRRCFPNTSIEFTLQYFEGCTNKYVIDYIYQNKGIHLTEVKHTK